MDTVRCRPPQTTAQTLCPVQQSDGLKFCGGRLNTKHNAATLSPVPEVSSAALTIQFIQNRQTQYTKPKSANCLISATFLLIYSEVDHNKIINHFLLFMSLHGKFITSGYSMWTLIHSTKQQHRRKRKQRWAENKTHNNTNGTPQIGCVDMWQKSIDSPQGQKNSSWGYFVISGPLPHQGASAFCAHYTHYTHTHPKVRHQVDCHLTHLLL